MYSQELADEICTRLESGQSLRRICRDKEMPDAATVLRWTKDKEMAAFAQQYADARARQYELLAEDILDISDDDELKPDDKRVRVDARKWMLSKMLPKVYGDKLDLNHSGGVSIIATKNDENL